MSLPKLKLFNDSPNEYLYDDVIWTGVICIKSNKAVVLFPEETQLIPTGVSITIPEGYCLEVKDTNNLITRGVQARNTVFNQDYSGEIFIVLTNTNKGQEIGENTFKIKPGDKIANLYLRKIEPFILEKTI